MKKRSGTETLYRLSGISRVFLEHNVFLKKFLTRFLYRQQDIEDVAQEAYLKAYGAEQEKGEIEQPKAFLFSIARNIALNELNRKSRQMTIYLEECTEDTLFQEAGDSEQELEALQTLGNYCEAIATLNDTCRKVYLLRKVHGLPHKEIALRLDISLSSVEKHLRHGILACKEHVQKQAGQTANSHPDGPSVIPMEGFK